MSMRAKDLMTSPVATVHPQTPAKEAARLLTVHGYTALPVVDGEGDLLGVVTEADLIRNRILPDPRALIDDESPPPAEPAAPLVGAVMTANPVTVAPTTDAVAITHVMLDRHLRALPVVDGDRLVGIVTRRDVLRTIARDDLAIARDVRHRLAIACHRAREVEVADGVVSLTTEGDDVDRHIAGVIAAALPGVREVRVVDPNRAAPS
jgi:CBS-domain-containing membrane protein